MGTRDRGAERWMQQLPVGLKATLCTVVFGGVWLVTASADIPESGITSNPAGIFETLWVSADLLRSKFQVTLLYIAMGYWRKAR